MSNATKSSKLSFQYFLEIFLPAFKNPSYHCASSFSFLFFIAWSLWWALYAIWLERVIGLTGEERGILYAVNQFTSILFMVVYGIVQDKLELKKHLIWLLGVTLALTGPFLIYVYEPLLKTHFSLALPIGSIFFGIGYLAGCALLDSFTEKMGRAFNFEYGTSRAWGSFGYAMGTGIAGYFFVINPHVSFWLVSLFGVMFLIVNHFFKNDQTKEVMVTVKGKVTKEDFIAVFKDVKFWILFVFITGSWSFYNIYDYQMFPVFYANLFEDNVFGAKLYSSLNAFQVVLESIGMAVIPFFVNKFGTKNSLLCGILIMICRIFVSASSENVYIISSIKLLHALDVPLCVIAFFKYSVENFDERLSSTIFLVGFQIASSLSVVAISPYTGKLLDLYGFHQIFCIFSAIIFSIFIFGIFFLSTGKEKYV